MANKKNKYTPIRKPKPEGSNNVTLATHTRSSARSSESAADKKKAMIQQVNDANTEDIHRAIADMGGSDVATLGLNAVGMENTTTLVVPHKGRQLRAFGEYHTGKGESPLENIKGLHDPKGKRHYLGDDRFMKKGKEFVSLPVSKQTSLSRYRATAIEEFTHAGQQRLPEGVSLQGDNREIVAMTQGLKSPHKKERAYDQSRLDEYVNPKRAQRLGTKWLAAQNKAAKFLLNVGRRKGNN
jgi:hypothetical protein